MIDPAFSIQRKTEFLGVPEGFTQQGSPVDALLNGVPYARMKQISTVETKPLYSLNSTDFSSPTVTDINRWQLENSVYDFVKSGPNDNQSDGISLSAIPSGSALDAPADFTEISDNATYLYVAQPGQPIGFSNSPMFQAGGIWSLNQATNNRLMVIYRKADNGLDFFFTRDLGALIASKYNATLVVQPTKFLLYVNGVLELDQLTVPRSTTKVLPTNIYALAGNPMFWARWLGSQQPSISEIQSILVPLI